MEGIGTQLGAMVREGGRSNVALRALIVVGVLVANGSCNRFQEAWVMNCDHTVSSPSFKLYDSLLLLVV